MKNFEHRGPYSKVGSEERERCPELLVQSVAASGKALDPGVPDVCIRGVTLEFLHLVAIMPAF